MTTTSRPNSFFGLDDIISKAGIALGGSKGHPQSNGTDPSASTSSSSLAQANTFSSNSSLNTTTAANSTGQLSKPAVAGADDDEPEEELHIPRARPSSFFGMQQPSGHVPMPNENGNGAQRRPSPHAAGTSSPAIGADARESCPSPGSIAPSQSASNYGSAERISNGATRPGSIAPTINGPLLDHSHLRPGQHASLLSHNKTLELYRLNAKKTNDPDLIYELAVFMVDAAKSMGGSDDSSGGSGPSGGSGSSVNLQNKEESDRDEVLKEAIGLLRKIADRGHPDAQYFLADCYANGIGTSKNKQDFDKAYPLFVLAAKHGHPDAAYRAGMCYEKGWGCRRDSAKAVQFYRKAGAQSHPGAMYRLGTAELNGDLGLKKSAREGIKWLKRAAEAATPEFPHALHELALLHERGVDNVLFADPEYACELLAQAGEMGYAPSAYKLGVNYEYGRMGCPQDAGLSIHMYNIAAQQNHKEACFALTAWYLVGAPGILPQSDTEAYLWAKRAAEQGLAKAEYAVGYFTEMGIGCIRDMAESRSWYRAAADHGDKRAHQRLVSMGAVRSDDKSLGQLGPRRGSEPASARPMIMSGRESEPPMPPPPQPMAARDQGKRIAAAAKEAVMANAPSPGAPPFRPAVDRGPGAMPPNGPLQLQQPMPMREAPREPIPNGAMQQQHQRLRELGATGNGPRSSGPPSIASTTSLPQTIHSSSDGASIHSRSNGSIAPPSLNATPRPQGAPLPRPPPMMPTPQQSLLQQQFQNMHMHHTGGPLPSPGGAPRPPPSPMASDGASVHSAASSLRNGPPRPPGPPFPSNGNGAMRRPPHGAEVAYLQARPPPPVVMGANGRPMPYRPQQRQNSAPPGMFVRPPGQAPNAFPPHAFNPAGAAGYRPSIPVLRQPMPGPPLTPSPNEAVPIEGAGLEKKKGLWAQLKAI